MSKDLIIKKSISSSWCRVVSSRMIQRKRATTEFSVVINLSNLADWATPISDLIFLWWWSKCRSLSTTLSWLEHKLASCLYIDLQQNIEWSKSVYIWVIPHILKLSRIAHGERSSPEIIIILKPADFQNYNLL